MTNKKGLKDAYSLKTPQDSIDLYRAWASTYDIDFAKMLIYLNNLVDNIHRINRVIFQKTYN